MARELAGSSRSLPWSSDDGNGTGGFQNSLYGFVNQEDDQYQDDGSVSVLHCTEAANKRIIETPKENNEQAEVADTLLSLRPFGLNLNLTPSLLDSVEKNLSHSSSAAKAYHHPKVDHFGSQPSSDKSKASNFSALLLRIGKWERRSKNEGDLVAKCYYAKRKLVWEFLEKGLKSKIEIQWNDIIAMRAFLQENQPGILELELNQPPTFHEEIDPQPRKHTIWRLTSDFTGRQASACRRHYLMFPPGSLDKHYEKLMHCDSRLYELSKKPFPSLQSPYFEPNICSFTNLSFDSHMNSRDVNLGLQFNFGIPSPLVATQQVQSFEQARQLSFKETTSPVSDAHISNNVFESTRMTVWGQGINNNLAAVDTFAPSIPFTQVNPAVPCQGYSNPLTHGQGGDPSHVNKMLNNLADHLFNDTKAEGYDEKYHMARVESLKALVNLSQEEKLASEDGSQQIFYGQEMGAGDELVLGANEQGIGLGVPQIYQQLAVFLASQVCPENPTMEQPWSNLSYPTVNPDPRMQNFCSVNNTINQFNSWT
ncbi:hypothetical protein GH714_006021 [Hevea brasiliensis]|uniref:TRF2/HOY1 PH-like domain-containing protein n=1 Tax=Hevea brasiliensis TaxID=3981 RepID=A0A6A6KJ24_HEVBR|nr:hypothetical protein GH714_006021 [Hevea brasiliensis]